MHTLADIPRLVAIIRTYTDTPVLLDTFCCAGGAAMGYRRAGFHVIGVDIDPQPRYPFPLVQGDAIEAIRSYGHLFDAVHASPPCQAYTNAQRIQGNDHPDLVAPTRTAIRATGRPYIIENVPGAPLINPTMLCGALFGLATYRHRLFETNWPLATPTHPAHIAPLTKMGRPPRPGEFMHIVGNFSGVARAREVMGMPWATRDEIREAIPPAYAEHIGRQLITHLETL